MNQHIKGVLAMIVAMLLFTVSNVLFKYLHHPLPPTEIVFFRNLFSFLPYLLTVYLRQELSTLKIDNYGQHFFRGTLGVISLSCLFQSLVLLPLADAMTLSYMLSIFAVLFSALLLKEKITPRAWLAVFLGFLGVIFVANPQGKVINLGIIYALISALCEAFLMVHGRLLIHKNSNSALLIYYAVFATIVSGFTLPFVWITPSFHDFGILLGVSIGGAMGQYFIVEAYRLAPISLLSPFIYTSLLWSILCGMILFGEIPSKMLYTGVSLIIAAGLVIIFQENRLRKDKTNQIKQKN